MAAVSITCSFDHMDDKRHGDVDPQDIVYGKRYLASLRCSFGSGDARPAWRDDQSSLQVDPIAPRILAPPAQAAPIPPVRP